MGDPPDGPEVLAVAAATGGGVLAVPENEIAGAQHLLADTEGIAVEPAGGVVVAAAGRLAVAGRLPAGARVVACLTGGPHDRWAAAPPEGIAPGRVTGTIPPTVSALSAAVSEGLSDAPEEPSR